MNTKERQVAARFGPEKRFEIQPIAAAPVQGNLAARFERLKNALLREHLDAIVEGEVHSTLRCAANEAAGLAWLTPFPLLFFPALFEEKVNETLARLPGFGI